MIYLTGDAHGSIDINKLSNRNLKKQCVNITKNDYLIILGDFGLPFLDSEAEETHGEYTFWINWLAQKPFTILWCDGNHENFNYWDSQPVTEWHGGKVQIHPKAPNVIHLMRGEIYDIEGYSFFAFGGALSHDRIYRVLNKTWWTQEEASFEEIENARHNLAKHNYKVDYIITHTPPDIVIKTKFRNSVKNVIPCRTAVFLNEILCSVSYRDWYCGHMHVNDYYSYYRMFCLYNDIIPIENE